MNKIENGKWRKFFKFSLIAIVVLFLFFLAFKGFSLEAIEKTLTYGAIIAAIDFYWVFCLRDANG